MSNNYNQKYLKYKSKYLKLKSEGTKFNMKGGADNTDNTMYLFKAEWCGHCKRFKSTWADLQKDMGNKIKFITYDSDANKEEIKRYNIEGYPTLILKTQDKAIEYVGSRDIDSLKDFIKQYI
jgi:thiol-disulfide isomerase/thioredoxin